jgi:hypothetical protein
MRLKPPPVNSRLVTRSTHFKVQKRSAWHSQFCFDQAILVRLSRFYRYGIALRTRLSLATNLVRKRRRSRSSMTPNEREMNAPMLKA